MTLRLDQAGRDGSKSSSARSPLAVVPAQSTRRRTSSPARRAAARGPKRSTGIRRLARPGRAPPVPVRRAPWAAPRHRGAVHALLLPEALELDEALAAQVVRAPLQHRPVHRAAESPRHEGEVLVGELVLQAFVAVATTTCLDEATAGTR